ncbi:MAG: nuclear transport factor 2 family protein [Acidobacteriota bacterium]|nr:nuclear transport factor 2 family protein [Acidobacteriota bacterium]
MKTIQRWMLPALVSLLAASAFALAPAPHPPQATTEAAAIRKVLDESVAAWNRGDIPAFLDSYKNSPQTIYIGGEGVVRGWQQIRDRYTKKYVTPDRGKMGVLKFTSLEIHPLGRGYALAIGQWRLERTAANGGNVGGFFTLTFQKTPAGWRIIVDHTS